MRISHCGDRHLEEDRYFADTAQCLKWFVEDSIRADTDLFVVDGDLTTYKATIRERNLWVDALVRMANHAPVVLVAGNHGAELEGDLYVYARARGKHPIYLCIEPEFIELGEAAVAVFPYPRKAALAGNDRGLAEAFARQLDKGADKAMNKLLRTGRSKAPRYLVGVLGGLKKDHFDKVKRAIFERLKGRSLLLLAWVGPDIYHATKLEGIVASEGKVYTRQGVAEPDGDKYWYARFLDGWRNAPGYLQNISS